MGQEGFQEKLTKSIEAAMQACWESLTKEQLLEYLAGQEQVTADYLRTMLANEGIVIQFGTAFDCAKASAETEI